MLKTFDLVIDFIFCIDILLNFFTSFINLKTGLEVVDNKEIAIKYLRSSFLLDLVSTLPLDELAKLSFGYY